MTSRYQPPRDAQSSQEKERKEKGQNYNPNPTPPPKVRQGVIRGVESKKTEDGHTYNRYDYNSPIGPESFHRLTKGKYKGSRSA